MDIEVFLCRLYLGAFWFLLTRERNFFPGPRLVSLEFVVVLNHDVLGGRRRPSEAAGIRLCDLDRAALPRNPKLDVAACFVISF
jgi:hypothetical protein